MTHESQIKMFDASLKDRNLDGEYLMLIKSENPDSLFESNVPSIIDQIIKFDKKGIGETFAEILYAIEVAKLSQTMCSDSVYKFSLWTLHNSLVKTKLPTNTNLLKMEEEGNKEELFRKCLKGIKDLNEVVSYSATKHYLELCESKTEMIDYVIRLNAEFFDFGGVMLSQTGIFTKYIIEQDIPTMKRLIPNVVKRYAFINRIDTQPQLQKIKGVLKGSILEIINNNTQDRVLSREEIHGASEGFLMLKYDEVSELVDEIQKRNVGKDEFFNILWLATLKRALLFNHNNRDFRANKSLGWILSISGITYLYGIKHIIESAEKIGLVINDNILADWIINAIWLILDTQKISLQGKELLDRLDAISPLNIKGDDFFSYEKMVEMATHLYPDQAIKEAFGFAYVNPESSFEVVCQMINYLSEYDNGDEKVESAFLGLSAALIDIVKIDFATLLGSYSAALIALTLSNRTIFNFGQGNSRYELVREMAKMFG